VCVLTGSVSVRNSLTKQSFSVQKVASHPYTPDLNPRNPRRS